MLHNAQQQRVQELQLEYLRQRPDLTAEELEALVQRRLQLEAEQAAAQEPGQVDAAELLQSQLQMYPTQALEQLAAEHGMPKAELEQLLMAGALGAQPAVQQQQQHLSPEEAALLEQAQA